MKDIIVNINKDNRMVYLPKTKVANAGENLQSRFVFKFEDEFVDGQAYLEYRRFDEEKEEDIEEYIILSKENDSYICDITNVLTNAGITWYQLSIYEGTDIDHVPLFISNNFYIDLPKNINAIKEAPEEYESWIQIISAKLNQVDEAIKQVDNLDIDAEKVKDTATVTITRKDGTQKIVEVKDGKDGQPGKDGAPGLQGEPGPSYDDTDVRNQIQQVNNRTTAIEKDYIKNADLEEVENILHQEIEGKQPIGNYALKNEIPDVSEFIKKTVNDLVNYYKKSETYTQAEVNQMISTIPKFKIEVVSTLPTSEISSTTIYLLKSGIESQNLYDEYIYVNNTWEKLGTQKVDLSNYVEKENGKSLLADTEIARLLTLHNYDDSEIRELISGKQDKIEDLNTIREGAAKGATAIQEHQDISGKQDKILIENSTQTTLEIQANKFYKFGEVTELNLTLAEITDATQLNEYMFEFVSGATATTLTLPDTIKWLETPTIESNKTYQCSIVDNIGILVGVANV